jgi:pyruvate formate lyase activating enzyme
MYKLTQLPPTPVSTLKNAREIAIKEGLKHVYIGNVPGSGAENTYCANCNEIVIERKGYRILQNNIENSKCGNCGHEVAGVWN